MWTPDPSVIITADQQNTKAIDAAWSALRAERDRRIASTDWTQLSDFPGDPTPWQEYRQALRDLPDNTSDPLNPDWPVSP